MKLTEVKYKDQSHYAVKLSDVPGKETGNAEEIEICKKSLGINHSKKV